MENVVLSTYSDPITLASNANEQELFIMRNDDIEAHITSHELKTKLNQFKQQLQLVKDIYKNSFDNSSPKELQNISESNNNSLAVLQDETNLTPTLTHSKDGDGQLFDMFHTGESFNTSKSTPNDSLNGSPKHDINNLSNSSTEHNKGNQVRTESLNITPLRHIQSSLVNQSDCFGVKKLPIDSAQLTHGINDASASTETEELLKIDSVDDIDTIYRDCSGEGYVYSELSENKQTNFTDTFTESILEELTANNLYTERSSINQIFDMNDNVTVTNVVNFGSSEETPKRCSSLPRPVSKRNSAKPLPRTSSSTRIPSMSNSNGMNKRATCDNNHALNESPKVIKRRGAHRRTNSDVSRIRYAVDTETDCQTSDPECDTKNMRSSRKNRNKMRAKSTHQLEIDTLRHEYEEKLTKFQKEIEEKSLHQLSLTLKLKYFADLSNELKLKCNNYEKQYTEISNEKTCLSKYTLTMKEKELKLYFEKTHLQNEFQKLNKEKVMKENELIKSQKMLNESFKLRKEAEECLLELRKKENFTNSELNDSKRLNQSFRAEVETLKKMCQDNDSRLKYYQQSDENLKKSLEEANKQIVELKQKMKEIEIANQFELKKHQDEHMKLQKEHEVVKLLYSESIKKIQESLNEIEELKRNQSASLHAMDNIRSLNRKTWFSHHPIEEQFQHPEPSISDNERDRNLDRTSIPRRASSFRSELLRPRKYFQVDKRLSRSTENYDKLSSDEFISESISVGSALNSGTTSPSRQPHTIYQSELPLQSLDSKVPFYRSTSENRNNEMNFRRIQSYDNDVYGSDVSLASSSNVSLASRSNVAIDLDMESALPLKRHPLSRDNNTPPGSTSSSCSTPINEIPPDLTEVPVEEPAVEPGNSWYIPVHESATSSRIPSVVNRKPKAKIEQVQAKIAVSKIPSRLSKQPKKSFNQKKSSVSRLPKSNKQQTLREYRVSTPVSQTVIIPDVTTDEALATVNEGLTKKTRQPRFNRNPITTRIAQLKHSHGDEDAEDILKLEEQLNRLNAEKEKLDSQLGRIPTRGSGRFNRQMAEQETKLQDQYDVNMNELATVRMELRRHKLL